MEGEDNKQTSFNEDYTEKQNNSFKEFFRNLDCSLVFVCFALTYIVLRIKPMTLPKKTNTGTEQQPDSELIVYSSLQRMECFYGNFLPIIHSKQTWYSILWQEVKTLSRKIQSLVCSREATCLSLPTSHEINTQKTVLFKSLAH